MQVVGPHVVHGGEHAVEHVVVPPVLPAALNGDHVAGVSHHADGALIPLLVGADGAQPPGGEILAHRAQRHAALGVGDGVGERLRLLSGETQHMERQTLGGLIAHARQTGELLH